MGCDFAASWPLCYTTSTVGCSCPPAARTLRGWGLGFFACLPPLSSRTHPPWAFSLLVEFELGFLAPVSISPVPPWAHCSTWWGFRAAALAPGNDSPIRGCCSRFHHFCPSRRPLPAVLPSPPHTPRCDFAPDAQLNDARRFASARFPEPPQDSGCWLRPCSAPGPWWFPPSWC